MRAFQRSPRSGALTLTLAMSLAAGAAWPPQRSAAAEGFSALYAGESAFVSLKPSETGSFTVFFENTGSLTWVRGSATQVDLAACRDDKVTCDSQDPPETPFNMGWLSPTRYATHAQPAVAPGAIATFSYSIRVPEAAAAGTYRFNGDLVVSRTGELIAPQGYFQDLLVELRPLSLAPLRLAREFLGFERAYGGWPPDLTIAAGSRVIAISSNDALVLRDRTGGLVAITSLNRFFDPIRPAREGLIDPTITYDPWSRRFFLAAAGAYRDDPNCALGACVAHIFLAVSKTEEPRSWTASDWYHYGLDATIEAGQRTANFPDHARVNVGPEVVVVVVDQFRFRDHGDGHPLVRLLPKARLIRGEDAVWTDFVGMARPDAVPLVAQQFQPALHHDPPSGRLFFLVNDLHTGDCALGVWAIEGPLSSAPRLRSVVLAGTNVPGIACFQPPDAPQRGTDVILSTGSGLPTLHYPTVYRAGSLWGVQHVTITSARGKYAGIRWFEIDVADWPDNVRVKQSGVVAAEGSYLFFPSIAVSPAGNVAIVYGRSGANELPSIHYTGRLGSDPPGTLRPSAVLKESASALSNPAGGSTVTYGDYFGAAIDPVDGSAWLVGEYVVTPQHWAAWVGQLDWSETR